MQPFFFILFILLTLNLLESVVNFLSSKISSCQDLTEMAKFCSEKLNIKRKFHDLYRG